ncbi:MAG: hypothetical protein GW802_16780 [Armatimonadetes bacterium]|nr:hypothetical protein [Armatimonadota bacterium]
MNTDLHIAPTDLRDYAKAHGWVLVPEAIADRLYVLCHPDLGQRQLVFPMDTTAPDYRESVTRIAGKLAGIEARPVEAVLASLQELRDDTLRIRIHVESNAEASLPLGFAASVVAGAQQLLLSAACTVVNPQAHHPRLGRTEAQQLVDAAQFRHTEHGSFVLKVSCPVNALDAQLPLLLPDEVCAPFVRRATIVLDRAVRELVGAIEADTVPDLVDRTRQAEAPWLSSNLCEALTRFHDDQVGNSVELSISWAATTPVLQEIAGAPSIRIQEDYFPRIDEVHRALRPGEEENEDTFVGTVERLDGEMQPDGRRAGEVVLALLLPDAETVRARTSLSADQYADADKAHMTDNAYVKVKGRLHPGRQPRSLTDVATFEPLWPGA